MYTEIYSFVSGCAGLNPVREPRVGEWKWRPGEHGDGGSEFVGASACLPPGVEEEERFRS